ncbi:hypothetical protein WH06_18540 [Aeromonas salmonicida subsp. salmonicida]|uniref:Lipoprotein n=3 Tax=Aeromonas salmonicida TaxID=645 RepID=A4SRE8_AERS4|nr:hypothetical protein [Aeromonas salmonicida]ABO91470.1 conserved hypothetical protein [Aeromonas salmonicida subsp. salmonicida A449]ASI22363.1 hypothetical protein CE456_06535 [Aeromonas salmonicida]ASI26678.1 hypothetical protein CE463_06565 [Aeromonas salmonicida]ASI30799.1 hypothetical protein CE462_05460 [Aeromonas salmonicida]ATD38052.1 hypothetical protein BHG40_08920 [Aeromonas salmonicida subsp. masoucida]
MKKWFIPLLALWLYGCYAGPGEEAIQHQVTAKLQSDTDDNLFEISDFAILGKEERMEGVYLIKVSYQLHFKLGLDQLQVLHDEDLVYDRVGPFQQEMGLMELERKYGDFEAGQVLQQETDVWMMKTEQGWRLAEPAQ